MSLPCFSAHAQRFYLFYLLQLFPASVTLLVSHGHERPNYKNKMAKILDNMKEVDRLATETTDVGNQVLDGKNKIEGAVNGVKGGMSGDFTALLKIVPGMVSAKDLCEDSVSLAIQIAEKAIEMAAKCDAAKNAIPCVKCCPGKPPKDAGKDDPAPADVTEDVKALESAKKEFEDGNLLGMATTGVNTCTSLMDKIPVIQKLVDCIITFCKAILEVTTAMKDMNLAGLAKQLPQILRCLDLSGMVKQFAEQLKLFVEAMAGVFSAMKDKVDGLNPMNAIGGAVAAPGQMMGAMTGGMWGTKE